MTKLYSIIIGLSVFIMGVVMAFFKGKRNGEQEERRKNIEHNLEVANEFKKDFNDLNAMRNDDVRNELRQDARN